MGRAALLLVLAVSLGFLIVRQRTENAARVRQIEHMDRMADEYHALNHARRENWREIEDARREADQRFEDLTGAKWSD